MITSGFTGWETNTAPSFVADIVFGPWTDLGNPCRGTEKEMKTTFDSQSTFVLENQKTPGQYIFMADHWQPDNAIDGHHIWLPIVFVQEKPVIKWSNEWTLK